jgi:alkanesulfonate monooxygenase SsuD/methylene tetrahydromethanopterin reductase-like flavin-dependent oxidoreductase (luciferase family)
MKFALHFGNIAFSDPEGARRLVRLAEAAGFDSVFAVEHVVFPDRSLLSIARLKIARSRTDRAISRRDSN